MYVHVHESEARDAHRCDDTQQDHIKRKCWTPNANEHAYLGSVVTWSTCVRKQGRLLLTLFVASANSRTMPILRHVVNRRRRC